MSLLTRARDFYRQQARIAAAAAIAARNQVQADPQDAAGLARVIGQYQFVSASRAALTMATEAGRQPFTQPIAFVGRTATGFPMVNSAQVVLDDLARQIEEAAGILGAQMLAKVDRLAMSEVADAGRQAASIEIVSEPLWTNYVRVLNPPSCPRCAVLAGRIYRDNDGFLRHPQCDCQHWPVESWDQAHDEGLVFSAKDAFDRGQIHGLSAADTQAIRDGADISKVVNAASGMQTSSIFGRHGLKTTLASTTKRSEWRKANPNLPIRLRPESIYDLAKDREDEIRLLKLYGYIKADANVPTDHGRAGGSGGGALPPAPPTPQPSPDDWEGRQAALRGRIPTGETLEHHEIQFLERMDARGEQYAWIPREASKPTNDFVWLTKNDIATEVKSSRPRFETIRRAIERSVVKAHAQNVTKANFIVDLGAEPLTKSLRQELAHYNRRPSGEPRTISGIQRLWVLSEDGAHLTEIRLEK